MINSIGLCESFCHQPNSVPIYTAISFIFNCEYPFTPNCFPSLWHANHLPRVFFSRALVSSSTAAFHLGCFKAPQTSLGIKVVTRSVVKARNLDRNFHKKPSQKWDGECKFESSSVEQPNNQDNLHDQLLNTRFQNCIAVTLLITDFKVRFKILVLHLLCGQFFFFENKSFRKNFIGSWFQVW